MSARKTPVTARRAQADTVERAEAGNKIEKGKLAKDPTSAWTDLYDFAAKIRAGELDYKDVEDFDINSRGAGACFRRASRTRARCRGGAAARLSRTVRGRGRRPRAAAAAARRCSARRGCRVDGPRGRVAAAPRVPRGWFEGAAPSRSRA